MAGGFGGDLTVTLESKTYDGNTAVFAALLAGSGEKEYTVEFYDGGYRYVSVRQLRAEAARTAVGSLTLDGVSYDAYADVSEQEICFWDAASGPLPRDADRGEGGPYRLRPHRPRRRRLQRSVR